MKNNTLAIALAALLVGGVATAAFMNNRAPDDAAQLVLQLAPRRQEACAHPGRPFAPSRFSRRSECGRPARSTPTSERTAQER